MQMGNPKVSLVGPVCHMLSPGDLNQRSYRGFRVLYPTARVRLCQQDPLCNHPSTGCFVLRASDGTYSKVSAEVFAQMDLFLVLCTSEDAVGRAFDDLFENMKDRHGIPATSWVAVGDDLSLRIANLTNILTYQ